MPTASAHPSTATRNDSGRSAGAISNVAWAPKAELEHPQWIAAGRRLGSIGRCSQWWLGDWVRYGASRWGEKYVEAAKVTGYDPKSLRNIAYVASRFDSSRRRDNLSWSHHAELAMLSPPEQDEWLDRASHDRLSVADLRTELRTHGPKNQSDSSSQDESESITCPNCGHAIPLRTTSSSTTSTTTSIRSGPASRSRVTLAAG